MVSEIFIKYKKFFTESRDLSIYCLLNLLISRALDIQNSV
jgi:hypothetical protein